MKKHNKENHNWKMGINQFSDLTKQQFTQIYLQKNLINNNFQRQYNAQIKAPIPDIDLRKKGYVTPVKNQGRCAAGWAFAATASHQSYHAFIQDKNLTMSQQQLIDCSTQFGNKGCYGGTPVDGLRYIFANYQSLNSTYPYIETQNSHCETIDALYTFFSLKELKGCDEIFVNLTRNAMAIRVDATNWQSYKSGIFDNCQKKLNHAVLLIGSNPEYWIVKNSWGASWGELGFMKLKMGDTCYRTKFCEYQFVLFHKYF